MGKSQSHCAVVILYYVDNILKFLFKVSTPFMHLLPNLLMEILSVLSPEVKLTWSLNASLIKASTLLMMLHHLLALAK